MPLSRDRVVRTALKLLDQVGLDALTMRRLATALGVQPGALYWHFTDKQALIDAMAEAMMEGVAAPPPSGAWDERLAEYARRMLDVASRHRDGVRVMSSMLTPGPKTLGFVELMLQILADGGVRGRTGLWASAVVGSYVTGFGLDVEAAKKMQVSGLVSMIRTMKQTLDPARYPQLLGVADELESMVGPKETEERFEFGLQLLLDGLRSTRRGPRRPRKARGARALKRRRRP